MLVLADVGEVGEVAEATDRPDRTAAQQLGEDPFEFLARDRVVVAMEAKAKPPDLLDQREDLAAFLTAHDLAEDTAEKADVVTQRRVLVVLDYGALRLVRPALSALCRIGRRRVRHRATMQQIGHWLYGPPEHSASLGDLDPVERVAHGSDRRMHSREAATGKTAWLNSYKIGPLAA